MEWGANVCNRRRTFLIYIIGCECGGLFCFFPSVWPCNKLLRWHWVTLMIRVYITQPLMLFAPDICASAHISRSRSEDGGYLLKQTHMHTRRNAPLMENFFEFLKNCIKKWYCIKKNCLKYALFDKRNCQYHRFECNFNMHFDRGDAYADTYTHWWIPEKCILEQEASGVWGKMNLEDLTSAGKHRLKDLSRFCPLKSK